MPNHQRRPRSLRGRLARAFVLVALVTLLAAFIAIGGGKPGTTYSPWRFRVLFPALIVAGGAGAFTARRIIGPISRLQDAVEQIDLRDLSLADVGNLSLHLTPVDAGELILDLVENLEPAAAAKEIELAANVAPGLPPLSADRERIRQVLVNLVANALQHTPTGGRVEVHAWSEHGQMIIRVADTGLGIAPADLPHIFDRFYRTDRSRARSTGGSGLGLAIVRSLVTLHQGTVEAESRPGAGSIFTIRLPLHAEGRNKIATSAQ